MLLNPSPYRDVSSDLLCLTDVFIVNESELCLLLRIERRPERGEAMRFLADAGSERTVVTCGADGSVVLDSAATYPSERETRIAVERVGVVDTAGCGDAYTGALAHRLAVEVHLIDAERFPSRASARRDRRGRPILILSVR